MSDLKKGCREIAGLIEPEAILSHQTGRIVLDPVVRDLRCFYWILDKPAPLAGMAYPEEISWQALWNAGFRHVVCLCSDTLDYDPAPLNVLGSCCLEELSGSLEPDSPLAEADKIDELIDKVVARLEAGEGVVAHCIGGTGRTGTILACTLHRMGLHKEKIRLYMDQINRLRRKLTGWPESYWHEEYFHTYGEP